MVSAVNASSDFLDKLVNTHIRCMHTYIIGSHNHFCIKCDFLPVPQPKHILGISKESSEAGVL